MIAEHSTDKRIAYRTGFTASVTLGLTFVATLALAGASASDPQAARSGVIAATVGEEPIDASEVARLLKAATRDRKVSPAALPVLQAQALAEMVDRRLVLAYARRTGEYPKAEEIDAAAAVLKSRLAAEGRTLDDHLRERSLSEPDLRRELAWGLVWDKYLAKYVTEARMAAHFEARRRQFDGTELAISHILLRPPSGTDRTKWDDLLKQAAATRRSILAGEISFADAAKKHSAGPSGKEGGKLGFIPRHGVMDEAFSRAAFTLDVGQVSEPVVTPFGVHLIRCDAIRPGTKQLADVRKELEDALARELLDKIARLEERRTPVRFTGKAPHFKPGTRELIVP
jgi:parvulin-like peptidyl-prolyl isomerase